MTARGRAVTGGDVGWPRGGDGVPRGDVGRSYHVTRSGGWWWSPRWAPAYA